MGVKVKEFLNIYDVVCLKALKALKVVDQILHFYYFMLMFLEINSTLKCMKGAFPVPSRNSEKKTWSLSLLLLLLLLLLLNCFCQAGAISRSGVLTQIQDQHPCLYSGHSWFFYVIPSVPSPSIAAAAPPPLLLGHAQDTPPGFQNGMDRTLLFFFQRSSF